MTLRNAREKQVTDWLAEREQDMLDLTQELVNIDSGSYDKAGVDAVGAVLERFLEDAGIPCDTIPIDERGDALRATVSGPAGNRPIMLMGHRDTVFDKGEAETRPFTIKNGRAYGPGVADMKSGLVMNAFILAAFAKFGGAPAPVIGLFTGDEEIGSPKSRPIIEAEARNARAVFNAEPGRASGNVVTARKGGVFFHCDIFGKSAHSGANFEEGVSAIEELARKIQAWHDLTDLDAGITVNIGLISGGQSVNSVAPHARCEIDTRYVRPADREELVEKIMAIAGHSNLDGARAEIEIVGEFHPVSQTESAKVLFDSYVDAAGDLGFEVGGEFTGGCADSGFTSAIGTPTLCGLGPVGGKAHSPEEYMEVASFVPRAQTVALSVMRLGTEEP
ncbi:MAG: M20 family metallopeptidase [Alphaproteobacteria bacterium]|nr:M20 family metallopeptidase [Alphaproteobacteria bacterium]